MPTFTNSLFQPFRVTDARASAKPCRVCYTERLVENWKWCVYTHAKTNGEVFWVGKGTLKRANTIGRKNKGYQNILNAHGRIQILISIFPQESEAAAFAQERALIKNLRELGVQLVNATDGGEGTSGRKHSPETIAKMKISNKRKWPDGKLSQEHREKISKGLRKAFKNPAIKAKLRSSRLGVRLPESRRRKISISLTGVKRSDATKRKLSIIATNRSNRTHTESTKQKISQALKGRKLTSETKQKLREQVLTRKIRADAMRELIRPIVPVCVSAWEGAA